MKYKLKRWGLKGKERLLFECPGCKLLAKIDRDQYVGKVSVKCPQCNFHKTINFKELGY